MKNIIDTAHQFDKTLAESFITLLDLDPARKRLKEALLKRIRSKEQISLAKKDFSKISELTPQQYIEVFDKNLSNLNSGRLASKKTEEILDILLATANRPLTVAYKSISYFIQNAIVKYFDNDPNLLLSLFESTYQNAKLVATFSADNITKMKALFKYTNKDQSNSNPIFRHGERSKFLKYLSNWIAKNVNDGIILIDPYFTENDLDFFKIINEIKPKCYIIILSSKLGGNYNESELQELYLKTWGKISEDSPPENLIIIVWDEKTNSCPYHDTWLIADKFESGLNLNSINAIGLKRDTQIFEMNKEALQNIENTVITDYIYKRKSKIKDFNLKYFDFKLLM